MPQPIFSEILQPKFPENKRKLFWKYLNIFGPIISVNFWKISAVYLLKQTARKFR
jgi:hypothetical protein